MWATGDYPDIATTIEDVSGVAVMETGVEAGETLLDVATGDAALAAARRGARVTGVDLTPALLDVARQRARAENLEIDFQEGDAEQLAYPDQHFDKVVSVFGAMFAPDQERRRAANSVRAASAEAWVDYLERVLGPIVLAKRALDEQGGWHAARADLVELYERFNEADDGSMHAEPEYLLTVVG